MLRRVLLIARKETWHILRDFRTVYMALGIPLVMLALFGYALTMDVDRIGLLVIDGDHTAASRDLTGAFVHSGFFRVVARADDTRGVLGAFRRNEARAALVIAAGFSRSLDRGEPGRAQLLVDGTDANVASIAMGYGAAIAQTRTVELAAEALGARGLGGQKLRPPVEVKTRNWFNPALRSQWYLVPGLIAIIMAMMSAILMALTVAREWERGTMEQLLVTPVHPVEIVAGKLIPYFVIGLGQLVLIAASGVALFDVPIAGNLLLLVALSSLFLVGALSQGLLISILTRQQQVAIQLAVISSMLPALLLSGFMSPISSMPRIIQHVTRIVPARYFLVILRGLFLKGVSFSAIRTETVALAVFAFVMLGLAVTRFKTRID